MIKGKIEGIVMYHSFLKPEILNILDADKISSGIVFKPPIIEKTKFHNIAMKRIKMTAPSTASNFIKKRTITGKNAKIGTDWIISAIGSIILSVLSFLVIKREMGIDRTRAKVYETKSLKRVLKEARRMSSYDSCFKSMGDWGVRNLKSITRRRVMARTTNNREEKCLFLEVK